jgi:hypothetical protein
MLSKIRRHLSFANVVSVIALFVALGGVAYAAGTIGSADVIDNSLLSADLKNNAAVKSVDVRDDSLAGGGLTGDDIVESSLSQVPSAAKANDAFSTWHNSELHMPDTLTAAGNPMGTLVIPHAGNYVVNATLEVRYVNQSGSAAHAHCVLSAGADSDTKYWEFYAQYENAALQVVHSFDSEGSVELACTDAGLNDVVISQTKITAVQVNNLTNSGF